MAAVRSHAPSLSRRFFIVLLAVSTAAVIVAFIASAILFQASGEADVRAALNRECDLIASALDISDGDDNVAIVRNLDLGGMRATLIDANGNVLMDSEGDASDMESHANRPEVQEALAHGEGSSERLSRTLDIVSFYHANGWLRVELSELHRTVVQHFRLLQEIFRHWRLWRLSSLHFHGW